LQTAEFRHTLPLGLAFRTVQPGVVGDYEERTVAAEYHYTWADWLSLSHLDRAQVIAHSRVRHMVDLAANDVHGDYLKRPRGTAAGG
jgi:hypothetical protein